MKTLHKSIGAAALALVLAPGAALAGGQLYFITAPNTEPFWPDAAFPVEFNMNPGTAVGQIDGVDPAAQFEAATEAAFQTWEDVPTSRITFTRGADSTAVLNPAGAGENLMVFNSTAIIQGIPIPLPPGALAVTNTFYDLGTGEISQGAVTFNTDPDPGNPNPDYSTTGAPGTFDVEAIMLHEVGHFQGMCHSNVRNDASGDLVGGPSNAAVMFPFLSPDPLDGRTPDTDDLAWHGYIYPSGTYNANYGFIQGDALIGSSLNGCSPVLGINGGHIVARDQSDPVGGEARMISGTYSYTADGPGRYLLPVPPGTYQVWAEPMDGSPVAALQINGRIQFTIDVAFPEDWYGGAGETGSEPSPNDPGTAVDVVVTAGATTSGIDLIINK